MAGSKHAGASANAAALNALPTTCLEDKRRYRTKCVALAAVLLVLCVLSLGIGVSRHQFIPADEVLRSVRAWFVITYNQLFCGKVYTTVDVQNMAPFFYQMTTRVGVTYVAVVCGIILTISGMVYQSVFRNPVAAPTMLGVAGGLNIGLLVFTWVYGASVIYETVPHYLYAYGGGLAALVLVLVVSRLINGKRWFSVVDMLLVGSIVSQVFGQIVLFVSYYVFDDSQWLLYTNLNEVLTVNTDPLAYAFLAVAFLISFIPIYLLRFRLNALSFSPEEARGMGVDQTRLRYLALFLGTIMVIVAMAHAGMVGMAALIVPFVARAYFGAETSRQITGNILLGAILVLLCRDIADMLTMVIMGMGFGFEFPIGVVASLVCMPVFVWIIARQQRTWE